jgi:hypothetical protein
MSVLLGRLLALREALDAVIDSVEQEQPKPECEHPEDKRKYTNGTMGNGSFTCGQCGTFIIQTLAGA